MMDTGDVNLDGREENCHGSINFKDRTKRRLNGGQDESK